MPELHRRQIIAAGGNSTPNPTAAPAFNASGPAAGAIDGLRNDPVRSIGVR